MIKNLFFKYKEIILYVFFGGLTTLVNYVSYFALTRALQADYMVSNILAWFLSVLFAYLTNRSWVFASKAHGVWPLFLEALLFFAARVFSGVLDTLILYVFYDRLSFSDIPVKIAGGVVVIVVNYILSKWVVFGKRREDANEN